MAKRGKLKALATKEEYERPIRWKKYKYLFLIVCEDQNTEPYYFNQFKKKIPAETLFLELVGTGRDPLGVVQKSLEAFERRSRLAGRSVDEVWVVFDKDDADLDPAKLKRFNEAFEIATQNNIEIAFSNEVFELWLLLHFTAVDSKIPIPRKEIYDRLGDVVRAKPGYESYEYEHGKPEIVDILFNFGSQKKAIIRAKKLENMHLGKAPIEANPSTSVYKLVEKLIEWIAYFSYESPK